MVEEDRARLKAGLEEAPLRILVVEDDAKVAEALKKGLQAEGYEVAFSPNGEDGFFRANAEAFDVILLDLMLPGRDGLHVLTALRKKAVQTPILILTAKDGVEHRVQGLEAGADDYLVKPFAFPELVARIRAISRRGTPSERLRLTLADLEMDCLHRKVTRGDRILSLTLKEYEILEYLLRHENEIVSREMLAKDVWKETSRVVPLDNVIDVHIARLRKKIDVHSPIKLIHTIRGVGFSAREGEA